MTPKQALLYARQNPSLRQNVCKYIESSSIAFAWAILFPEDKDIMRDRINESRWAYRWALKWPEDKDIMRERIVDSYWAFQWAIWWPEDKDIVRKQIKDPFWFREWIRTFGPDPGLSQICKKE